MKQEKTDEKPLYDLLNPVKTDEPQAHSKVITKVLLNNGKWYNIVWGSFKFYKTSESVPFVRFTVLGIDDEEVDPYVVEVFPATVAGWAYPE